MSSLKVRAFIGSSIAGLFIASRDVGSAKNPRVEHAIRLTSREGKEDGWANLFQDEEATFYVLLDPEQPRLHASLRPFICSITMVDEMILGRRQIGQVAPGTYTSTSGKCTAIVAERQIEGGPNHGRTMQSISFRVEGNDANALNLFFEAVMSGNKESDEQKAARPPKAAADASNAEPSPA
ncbi:hypothetical protein KBA73_04670, partial [Patescibacteria group bacterium]|nr:hypothetical protein [Patescibacteria group bacterium]